MRSGYKPWEYRTLTLREAMNVVMAFNDNRRHDMQMVATMGSYIANFGGYGSDKTVRPSDLIPQAFSSTAGVPSKEWLEEQYRREREHFGDGDDSDDDEQSPE